MLPPIICGRFLARHARFSMVRFCVVFAGARAVLVHDKQHRGFVKNKCEPPVKQQGVEANFVFSLQRDFVSNHALAGIAFWGKVDAEIDSSVDEPNNSSDTIRYFPELLTEFNVIG